MVVHNKKDAPKLFQFMPREQEMQQLEDNSIIYTHPE